VGDRPVEGGADDGFRTRRDDANNCALASSTVVRSCALRSNSAEAAPDGAARSTDQASTRRVPPPLPRISISPCHGPPVMKPVFATQLPLSASTITSATLSWSSSSRWKPRSASAAGLASTYRPVVSATRMASRAPRNSASNWSPVAACVLESNRRRGWPRRSWCLSSITVSSSPRSPALEVEGTGSHPKLPRMSFLMMFRVVILPCASTCRSRAATWQTTRMMNMRGISCITASGNVPFHG